MMRKVYRDLIIRKVRETGSRWLLRRLGQYLLLHLSELIRRPLCGPALGTLMVTYRCNFHCGMCDMPVIASKRAGEGRKEFDTSRFIRLIRDFAALGIPGIGFTGGEPLLRQDIFELLAETRRQGMITHLNTNGWLLGDQEAHRIVEVGVDSVNVSLDGATASTHDRIRNRPGSFDRAVAAIERLVRLKNRQRSELRIKTVAVLDENNIEEVPKMISLGRSLGTSCIEFIPRQPFIMEDSGEAPSLEILEKIGELANFLLDPDNHLVPIENSPRHLRLFRRSFAGLPSQVRCRAGYNSVAVDCYGDVFPCVPWINWGKAIGNIRNSELRELWRSPSYQQKREAVHDCRACYLNCQTELNLLFDFERVGSRG